MASLQEMDSGMITQPDTKLEIRVARLGQSLADRLSRVMSAVPGAPAGPVKLARAIGIDKVLASRALKAVSSSDPIAALKLMPGPEPLRRLSSAAGKNGVSVELIHELEQAVGEFDELIREEAGDRSALDAILASWLPDARAEFELRRKQAAYRAMSQLKGSSADVLLASVFFTPSKDDPDKLDLVWVMGMLGLQRVRPGSPIKYASRRLSTDPTTNSPRQPTSLDGTPVDDFNGLRLDQFCSKPLASIEVQRIGEVVHYLLGDDAAFGPHSGIDLVFGEMNRRELPRYVPRETPPRQRFAFAEISIPSKRLVFDAYVHRDLLPTTPTLSIYETAFEGTANVNDRSRDIDKFDLQETVTSLGGGFLRSRCPEAPWYGDLLSMVATKLAMNPNDLVGWRTEMDYPIYGTQVVMAWEALVRE
jgi:hypothetical protein